MERDHAESCPEMKSLASEFKEESAAFFDNSNTLLELYKLMINNITNSEKNMKQLTHMAEIVADPSDPDDFDAVTNFAYGEIFGYIALIKIESDEVLDKIHEAVKDLYALGRYMTDKQIEEQGVTTDLLVTNESYLQRITGVNINEIISEDISFNDSIPVDELEVVYGILEKLTDEEDEKEASDAIRGYIFIRAVLSWHESYKKFRDEEKLDSDFTTQAELHDFYELIADIDIDKYTSEGKFDVTEEVVGLVERFDSDAKKLALPEDPTLDDINALQTVAHESLIKAMSGLKELPFRHRVSIEGKGVIIITDDNDELLDIVPIFKGNSIEGRFVNLQVQMVPTEKSVNTAYKRLSKGKALHIVDGRFNPLGVAMQIDKVYSVTKQTNNHEKFPDEHKYFIPLNYEGTKVLKVMVDMSDIVIESLSEIDNSEEE